LSELPSKRRFDRLQPLIRQPASVHGWHITKYLNRKVALLIRWPAGECALRDNQWKGLQQSPSAKEYLIVAVACHGFFSFASTRFIETKSSPVSCRLFAATIRGLRWRSTEQPCVRLLYMVDCLGRVTITKWIHESNPALYDEPRRNLCVPLLIAGMYTVDEKVVPRIAGRIRLLEADWQKERERLNPLR
jgi:hypothetical protein